MNEVIIEEQTAATDDSPSNESWSTRAWFYGPLLAWMAFIFYMSTGAGVNDNSLGVIAQIIKWLFPRSFGTLSPDRLEVLNHYLRKLGHLSEYFILALLALRALRSRRPRLDRRMVFAALVFSAFYACSDEFHQYFVPGRTAAVQDVLIDTVGAGIAVALASRFAQRSIKSRGHDVAQSS